MKISTSYFGSQEIDPNTVIMFPNGIPGFENFTKYKLFHEEGKPTVFWLQSVEDPEVVFSVAPPELFNITYEVNLSDEEAAAIELEDPVDVTVMVILARHEGEPSESDKAQVASNVRANLYGPLVINAKHMLGMQKVVTRLEQFTVLRAVD